MLMTRPTSAAANTIITLLTADTAFEEAARATFGPSRQIEVRVVNGRIASCVEGLDVQDITVLVIDLDASQEEEIQALGRLMTRIASRPPVVVVTQGFDETVARRLLQMRVADFMVKPVQP